MVNIRHYFIAWAAAFALAACAAPENQMLDQARAAYSAARNDPRIIQKAPMELNQAAQTLQEAENLFEGDAEERQVTHQAYLANQKVAIAREAAQLKMTQEAIDTAEVQRQQVLLQARSREAEMARQQAARTQKELEQAQTQLSETERTRQAAMRQEEIARLQQQIRDAETRETPRGIVLTMKDIVFEVDKAELNPGSQRTIAKIADFLKQHPDRAIVIEGFTDSTGSTGHNRQLSEARAEAVRNALVQQGIEGERITAQGFGEDYPVANNATPAGRQLNRRVEIVISDGAGGPAGVAGGREMQRRTAGRSTVQPGEMPMLGAGGMNLHSADQFIGMTVRDRQGQQIGEVTDVMINVEKGRAGFARVSGDGKSYLVPLGALTSEPEGNYVTLNADRSRIETSPLPRQGMSEEQYGRELYEHYGLSYPFEDLPAEEPVREEAPTAPSAR
jgi:outer membrane protein OmpA-like peptidoglycan-associated protein